MEQALILAVLALKAIRLEAIRATEVAQEAMPQTTKVVVAQQATLGTVGTAKLPLPQAQVGQQAADITLQPTELAQEVVQASMVKVQLDTVGILHGQD